MRLETIVVVICVLVLFPCVLTEAKVIKLSVEEMLQVRGNVGCAPQQYCREKCKITGTECQPPSGGGGPCTPQTELELCYACVSPPKDEICDTICTTNPNQSCVPDPDAECPLESVGFCANSACTHLQQQVSPRCSGGPMRQCH